MAKLFGTDGIRGIANREVTPEVAFRLGEAVVHFLADKGSARFVIGRDTRLSGDMLESALVAGITAAGGTATVCGIVPTPAVAVLVRELGADGGIVISASHNPPEFNGLKVFTRDGFKLPEELERSIEEFLVDDAPGERPTGAAVGTVERTEGAADWYADFAVGTLGDLSLRGLKVAIDCGHGASYATSPVAFERAGAEVIAINTDFDGTDINVSCGSTDLTLLAEVVRAQGCDFGIGHDGDADRMLAVDADGAEVDGDQIMAILAVDMADRGVLAGGTVVSTVMCNLGFEHAMKDRGIQVVKTQVGDKYVLEQMLAMGANLGGEQSGHIILLDHNSTGDGLVTGLALADVVARSGKSLAELAGVMSKFPQVLKGVHTQAKERLATSAAISEAIERAESELGDNGRVLVRASGTEPLVRVMVEARDTVVAERITDDLVNIISTELGD